MPTEAERVIREALADPALHDPDAPLSNTIDAVRAMNCACSPANVATVLTELERARGLLLLALYHHQGGSSTVGQPIRRFLGIGQHAHLTPEQVAQAKDAEARGR